MVTAKSRDPVEPVHPVLLCCGEDGMNGIDRMECCGTGPTRQSGMIVAHACRSQSPGFGSGNMPHKCIQLFVVLGVLFTGPVSLVRADEAPDLRLVPYPKQVERKPGTFSCRSKLILQLPAKVAATDCGPTHGRTATRWRGGCGSEAARERGARHGAGCRSDAHSRVASRFPATHRARVTSCGGDATSTSAAAESMRLDSSTACRHSANSSAPIASRTDCHAWRSATGRRCVGAVFRMT